MENEIDQFYRLSARIKRKLFAKRIDNLGLYLASVKAKNGLEIGGPSGNFRKRGLVPVYSIIDSLDGCNFCSETVWEGQIDEGPDRYMYQRGKHKGYQYIKDGVDLHGIAEGTYDFVLSSHCLEHIANPFKAILEWLRVLRDGGFLLMLVPHKEGTSDHQRPVTSLEHLIDDFEQGITEADLSHLPEILELQAFELELANMDLDSFRYRALKNYENRCLHHHVFDTDLVVQIMDQFKLQILDVQPCSPVNIITLAQKIAGDCPPDNSLFLSRSATYRHRSPFPSDRI